MWKYLGYILISAIFLTTVFGFAFMSHSSMTAGGIYHMDEGCLASVFSGLVCLQNGIVSVIHCISAYQSFIGGLLVNSFVFNLAVILAFLASIVYFVFNEQFFSREPLFCFLSYLDDSPFSFKKKKNGWLSLLENSPSF